MWKTDDSYFTSNKWNNNLRLDPKNENNNMDTEFTMLYHGNCSRNMENCGASSTNQNWIVPTNTPATRGKSWRRLRTSPTKLIGSCGQRGFSPAKTIWGKLIDGFIMIYSGTLQFDPYNWGLCFRKDGTNGSETIGI